MKSRFLEKHGMKLINEKNKCAHSVGRAHHRNTAGEQLLGEQRAGCLRVHPVFYELTVVTGGVSVKRGLPSDAILPKLPL